MNPWSLFFSVILVLWITLGSWLYTCQYMQLCTNLNTHSPVSDAQGHSPDPKEKKTEPAEGFTVRYKDQTVYKMNHFLNYKKGDSLPQQVEDQESLLTTVKSYLDKNPSQSLTIFGYFQPEEEDSMMGWKRALYFQNLLRAQGAKSEQVRLSTYGKKLESDEEGFLKNGLLMAIQDIESPTPDDSTSKEEEEKPAENAKANVSEFTEAELKLIRQKHLINFPYRVSHVRPSPEDQAFLDLVARYLKSKPEIKVLLVGHTDNTGDDEKNIKLGLQRANFVADILERQGISKNRITTRSEGAKQPLYNNDTESNRQKNRRVEITLQS